MPSRGMKGSVHSLDQRPEQAGPFDEEAIGKVYQVRPTEDEILQLLAMKGKRATSQFNKSWIIRSLIRYLGEIDPDFSDCKSELACEDRIRATLVPSKQGGEEHGN